MQGLVNDECSGIVIIASFHAIDEQMAQGEDRYDEPVVQAAQQDERDDSREKRVYVELPGAPNVRPPIFDPRPGLNEEIHQYMGEEQYQQDRW